MKKTFMSVILGFSFFVHGENKLSFADCVEQTFGTKYGNRVHWATLRLKTLSNGEIVTNNNPEQNKLTVGGKIAKALQENKQYLKCLKSTTAIFMQKNADESVFLCSRNFENLQTVIHELLTYEQDRYNSFGWALKSKDLLMLPLNGYKAVKVEQVKSDGSIVQQFSAKIKPDECFSLSSPCQIVSLRMDEGCQVSNEELALIAFEMLKSGVNAEFHAPHYSLKLTIIKEKTTNDSIDMSEFFPKRPKK